MKLTDWNKSLDFAEKICRESGINIRPREYEMYDGRKGIYIRLFDCNNKFYQQWASGIWDTYLEMENALKWCVTKAKAA